MACAKDMPHWAGRGDLKGNRSLGMNLNEISRLGLTKQGLLGSFGARLYLAFGAIILLTVITTALSLYSFNRFGDVVQRTTTETIPLVVGAKDLAERSLSLTASAQSIALAGDTAPRMVSVPYAPPHDGHRFDMYRSEVRP